MRPDSGGAGGRRPRQEGVAGGADRRQPRLIYRGHRGRRSRGERRKRFTEQDYARLLDDAHRQLGGPLAVVRDGLNTRVSGVMAGLAAARDRLAVFRLPRYAHELNPGETAWSLLKRSLADLGRRGIRQLAAPIKARLRRMQHRPGLLSSFLARTGLDFTPFPDPRN